MTRRMLIDATHSEETRVAVVDGNKLVDFDYESQVRKQLKGSIFLAKVTRVEPSLQAAFVNFGGNRHGFLPFSEVHPDYFRIPIADREALIAEQQREMEERLAEEEAEDEAAEAAGGSTAGADHDDADHDDDADGDELDEIEVVGEGMAVSAKPLADDDDAEDAGEDADGAGSEAAEDETEAGDDESEEDDEDAVGNRIPDEEDLPDDSIGNTVESADEDANGNRRGGRDNHNNNRRGGGRRGRGRRGRSGGRGNGRMAANSRRVEVVGGDGIEGDGPMRPSLRKNYKIQEVIKRGQIMLVQVSKEERGNKGAAVSTYLSLPGRYCVLMPNSPRAGGVSRKIANYKERKRMREILNEFNVPQGMSVIMRTAGVSRTKTEIKRDLDYLMKLWDNIRETTLSSSAPAIVHEEGNLIRRSIRDIYSRDIDEIVVSGDDGYKFARDFMKMMIPSHVKRVKQYKDDKIPLFHRYQVENQISEIGDPTVTLPSGGYLVINPTEALVSVDVNSGKSTKERHIEETALRTNLEAAEEVARQLRLRDLGGLVVVDFIDMEDRRNNRKVENRMKDALSTDRARIQIGRISSFGLMELSRQRLNPSLTEAQFEKCAHCQGIGYTKTVDAAAINALRALEDEGIRERSTQVILYVSNAVALYLLNNKRHRLAEIEARYGFTVTVSVNDTLPSAGFIVEPVKNADDRTPDEEGDEPAAKGQGNRDRGDRDRDRAEQNGEGRRRRGRRGGRRRGNRFNDRNGEEGGETERFADEGDDSRDDFTQESEAQDQDSAERGQDDDGEKRGRNRSRRRGRGRGRGPRDDDRQRDNNGSDAAEKTGGQHDEGADSADSKPARSSRPVREERKEETGGAPQQQVVEKVAEVAVRPSNDTAPPVPKDYEVINEPPGEKKRGWWNRFKE